MAAIFFWFLAYRVLMVWVYSHTQSVLMAMLMHLTISVMAFLMASPAMVGAPDLIFQPHLRCDAVGLRGRRRGGRPHKALATRVWSTQCPGPGQPMNLGASRSCGVRGSWAVRI